MAKYVLKFTPPSKTNKNVVKVTKIYPQGSSRERKRGLRTISRNDVLVICDLTTTIANYIYNLTIAYSVFNSQFVISACYTDYKLSCMCSVEQLYLKIAVQIRVWATVCKTVRPMLSDRCPVCPSVTFVYSGQTVERIKMKLGMQVGLVPGHIVLDGSSPSPKGLSPPSEFFAHVARKWLHGSRCHLVWR